MKRGRDRAAALGIHLLLDDAVVIGGMRYLGGTPWTDFLLGAFGLTHAFGTAQGRDGMVDYRRIRTGPHSRNRIEPSEVLAIHRATRTSIETELARPHNGSTVVVSHHAPHPASLQGPHADLPWCYASDLTDMILDRGPDLWLHGHAHHAVDYRVGRTRILCNPRGHCDERTGFTSDAITSLP